jgi:hypothetical protein
VVLFQIFLRLFLFHFVLSLMHIPEGARFGVEEQLVRLVRFTA